MVRRAFGVSLLGALLCSGSALAGVVVLKNGNVIVGDVRPQEITVEQITVRNPRGEEGTIVVPRHEVRWYDVEADQPTADYWERFPTAPLDPLWVHTRPQPGGGGGIQMPPPPPVRPPAMRLNVFPTGDPTFELRGPKGWDTIRERGVTMLVSDKALGSEFRPRIHVFSVESPQGASYSEQLEWIEAELARLADEGGYEVDQLYQLREVGNGADQRMVTVSRVGQRRVRALRQVFFRGQRTWFFAAYADDDDYDQLKGLFRQVLETVKLLEG